MATDILDGVYGCLIGGDIGDTLGAPVEGLYYTRIRAEYGKVDRLLAPAHRTDYSLFRLGRDYMQRTLTMGWRIPVSFTVSHS